jgi:replication initiation and membrane attachment protein DnaB
MKTPTKKYGVTLNENDRKLILTVAKHYRLEPDQISYIDVIRRALTAEQIQHFDPPIDKTFSKSSSTQG